MDELTLREIQKKYNQTTVALMGKDTGKQLLAYFVGFDGYIATIEQTDPETTERKSSIVDLREYDLLPIPKSCVFNYGTQVAVYSHWPERQWRVGICHDNSYFYYPAMELLSSFTEKSKGYVFKANVSARPASKSLLSLFFKDPVSNFSETIKAIKANNFYARTMTDKWSLTLGLEEDSYFLMYMNILVGAVSNREIKIYNQSFKQEVKDLLNFFGEYYNVD